MGSNAIFLEAGDGLIQETWELKTGDQAALQFGMRTAVLLLYYDDGGGSDHLRVRPKDMAESHGMTNRENKIP